MQRRRTKKWKLYSILTTVSILVLALLGVFLLSCYPVMTVTSDFDKVKSSRFSIFWPQSLMEQELSELKRMSKFKKEEQQRRVQVQLRRMKYLNNAIFDLHLDSNIEIIRAGNESVEPRSYFTWPTFSDFILLPYKNYTRMTHTILLTPGDEIKATLPVTKSRRNLTFEFFPLAPGRIFASFGQYSWSRTFTAQDIHKNIEIFVPVNDNTASSLRIVSLTANAYVSKLTVNRLEPVARGVIRVSDKSLAWVPDEKNLIVQKIPPKISALAKPLLEPKNKVLVTSEGDTLALGYNLIVVHLSSPGLSKLLSSIKHYEELAPTFSHILKASNRIDFEETRSASELFLKTIFPYNAPYLKDRERLVEEETKSGHYFNLYRLFRTYGYQVGTFANPSLYFLNSELSRFPFLPKYKERWLSQNDWDIAYKGALELPADEQATGLDAIFKKGGQGIPDPLQAKDISYLTQYTKVLARNTYWPLWQPTDFIVLNEEKDMYLSRLIYSFQHWLEDNTQRRFLSHLYLELPEEGRSSFQHFFKALKFDIPAFALNQQHRDRVLNLLRLELFFNQLYSSLVAKRVQHRTIISFIVSDPLAPKQSFYISIPGLSSKKKKAFEGGFYSVLKTLTSVVGVTIPHAQFSELEEKIAAAPNLDSQKGTEEKMDSLSHYQKFSLFILPSPNHECEKISWNSGNNTIIGLDVSGPIIEFSKQKKIAIYPCSIKNKISRVIWYQKKVYKEEILGGKIFLNQPSDQIVFLLGKNYLRSESIYNTFSQMSQKEIGNLLHPGEYKNIKDLSNQVAENVENLRWLKSDLRQKSVLVLFSETL